MEAKNIIDPEDLYYVTQRGLKRAITLLFFVGVSMLVLSLLIRTGTY